MKFYFNKSIYSFLWLSLICSYFTSNKDSCLLFIEERKVQRNKSPHTTAFKILKTKRLYQKTIADVYGVSERMVRYWKRDNGEPKKWLRGRKMKIDGDNAVSLLLGIYYDLKNSTQQEMADYYSGISGQKVSRFAVSRALKILGITRKKTSYINWGRNENT